MYIGSAKNNRPKFTKIVWTKANAKTLGIHHGYNIQNDEIWKSIIVTPMQQTFLSIRLMPPPQIKSHTKVVISFTYFSGIPRISIS
jgi:hypothetical protein